MKKKFRVCQLSNENGIEIDCTAKSEAPGGWGCRHTFMILTFFGSAVSYMLRSNLSMAIVGMVHHDDSQDNSDGSSISSLSNYSRLNDTEAVCSNLRAVKSFSNSTSTNEIIINGEFHWDTEQQGIILGSFFWGYIITHIPAGLLADKFGGKNVMGLGLLVASIFALFTPFAARYGIIPLIIVRVVQGLGEGFVPPATHSLIATWSPPLERCKFGAFIYAGNQAGTILGMIISGMIIHYNFLGLGWPGVFYVEGLMGCVWFVFWCFFLFSKPSEHPRISDEERQYIEGALEGHTSKESISTPWRGILTSMPMWAILVAQTGNSWGLYTLMTELPTYMHRVLRFDIKSNCWLSAMPFFCMLVSAILVSQCGDYFRAKKILSTTSSRKLFNSVAHWGCALMLLLMALYAQCDRKMAVTFLIAGVGLSGLIGGGYQINHVDISPNYSGILMAICNGVANVAGILAPYVAGKIIKEKGSLSDWQMVFLISAAVYLLGNLFYLLFASGEIQPWNEATRNNDKNDSSQENVPEMTESERL